MRVLAAARDGNRSQPVPSKLTASSRYSAGASDRAALEVRRLPTLFAMRIRGYDIVALAKKTWSEVGKDKIGVYASQMAYSLFFALFPLLLFLAALLSLVA